MNIAKVSMTGNFKHSKLECDEQKPRLQAVHTGFTGVQSPISNVKPIQFASSLRAVNNISFTSLPSFRNKELSHDLENLRTAVVSCGNQAGEKISVSGLLDTAASQNSVYSKHFERGEGVHTAILLDTTKNDDGSTKENYWATTSVEKANGKDLGFIMNIKEGCAPNNLDLKGFLPSTIKYQVIQTPDANRDIDTYVLHTKGKTLAAVSDKDLGGVIMTNTGKIAKKQADKDSSTLSVKAYNAKNSFQPFVVKPKEIDPVNNNKGTGGVGAGLVIAMQDERYVAETMKSIEEFQQRVENGEIDFGPFSAAEGAKDTKIIMLAGGYGSRAEYANAASDRILHADNPDMSDKAQTNKGIIQLPTGLNAMETTFKTLHEAGIIDCSKGKFKIGEKVEFYINKAGNKGNGGFTLDVYKKLKGTAKNFIIVPNDAISRMTEATASLLKTATSGSAAMAMIAKMTDVKDAQGKLGIMAIDEKLENSETKAAPILEFAEKPKVVQDIYKVGEAKDKCLSNTFQFSVSEEAFEALDALEPFFPGKGTSGGESRDWSKCYTRIIKALTEIDDMSNLNKEVAEAMSQAIEVKPNKPKDGFKDEQDEVAATSVAKKSETEAREAFCSNMKQDDKFNAKLAELKEKLANQRLYAIPTSDSWIDAGNTNDLYHVLMQIASGDFILSNKERNRLLDCMEIVEEHEPNTGNLVHKAKGFVASTPELKKSIMEKYHVGGEVIAFENAKEVNANEIMNKYAACTIINDESTAS